jgi:hypothetical protein
VGLLIFKKLDWLNGVYIRKLSQAIKRKNFAFCTTDFPQDKSSKFYLIHERLVTLAIFSL